MADPQERSRPVGAASTVPTTTTKTDNSVPDLPVTNRRYWARRMIDKARGAEIPSYGSPVWSTLPEGDPRKVASVVVAAEAWAQDGDDIETRLRRELANRRHGDKRAEDVDYRRDMREHRESWRILRSGAMAYVMPLRAQREEVGGDDT